MFNVRNDYSIEIQQGIERINEDFLFKLKSNWPDLSEGELNLASLIVLGLSAKEISGILNIESKSVNMKRYRLKKRLGLETDEDLQEFLKNL